MGIPAFTGLKYPKVIYSAKSDFNGQIEVIQVGETRKVKVGGIDQSLNWDAPNTKRLVWGRVVEVIKLNEPNLKNILVMGLGGGTVQHLLSQEFPGLYMISVDIDPVMEQIAREYFDLDKIPNHRVIIDDACRVVIEPESFGILKHSLQVAFVDIYVGDKFPDLGNSGNFLAALKNLVIAGGLIVINRIYTENHQDDVNSFIEFVEGFLHDVQTYIVAGYTNSDNVLIYGRT